MKILNCNKEQIGLLLQYSLQEYGNGKFKYHSFCAMCKGADGGGLFEQMSRGSNYYSSCNGHLCDMDCFVVKTSLWLHNFGSRFYGCREWTPVSLHLCLVTLFILCHKFLYLASIDIVMYVARQ